MDPVASTAYWVAAARARESRAPDALIHDPFAAALAGEEGERWFRENDDELRMRTYIAVRTRFFDDELLRAAREDGVRQIVILAAGLDARAYRLEWPEGTTVFELDRPEVLAHKDEILDAASAEPRCTRRAVGVDLTERWADDLRALGLRPEVRSAWLVEGLLPYLREAQVHALLSEIAALAATGSALTLDCSGVDPFSVPDFARQAETMRERGIRMFFSCDDPVALLARHGFAARREGVPELARRAGRAEPPDVLRAHLVAGRRV